MERVLRKVDLGGRRDPLLTLIVGATVIGCVGAAAAQSPLPLALPAAVLLAGFALRSIRDTLVFCLALIPLSTEVNFGPLGTDLPSEPLMWVVTGLCLLLALTRAGDVPAPAVRHPITLALVGHLIWILIATVTSEGPVTSLKFLLAKVWYVVPFYFLAVVVFGRVRDVRRLFLWVTVTLVPVLVYCVVRHISFGVTFADVNAATRPFFRNHVGYAALCSMVLPYLLAGVYWYRERPRLKWWFAFAAALTFVAIQTSFTRAAYVSLLAGLLVWPLLRWRLVRLAVPAALAVAVAGVTFLTYENRFFDFAPNYETAITHYTFEDILEATYKLEDISTMERVYRWVAGGYMAAERPVFGVGPGKFYDSYRPYALERFRTYVSDNPEHSGVHNYFLMLVVEQGYPGLAFFVVLCIAGFGVAERAYHATRDPARRVLVLAAAASFTINLSFQLINDIIETDKAGAWFFLSLALLTVSDQRSAPPRRRDPAAPPGDVDPERPASAIPPHDTPHRSPPLLSPAEV